METFGQRLTDMMERAGITTETLALLAGVSKSLIENFAEGYLEPSIETLCRIAQIFGVSIGYVAMLTDDPKIEEDDSVREIYVASELGRGGSVRKNDLVGTLYIKKEDMHGKSYYALLMPDDSLMRARIRKGDVLIVRKQNQAENGDIVVVSVDDDVFVRRFEKKGNMVVLHSENPRFEALKVDTSEQRFVILGKVDEVRIRNL